MKSENTFPGSFYCILKPIPGEQSDIWDAHHEDFICCTKATPQCMFPSEKAALQVVGAEVFDDSIVVAQFILDGIDTETGKMSYSINRFDE